MQNQKHLTFLPIPDPNVFVWGTHRTKKPINDPVFVNLTSKVLDTALQIPLKHDFKLGLHQNRR